MLRGSYSHEFFFPSCKEKKIVRRRSKTTFKKKIMHMETITNFRVVKFRVTQGWFVGQPITAHLMATTVVKTLMRVINPHKLYFVCLKKIWISSMSALYDLSEPSNGPCQLCMHQPSLFNFHQLLHTQRVNTSGKTYVFD